MPDHKAQVPETQVPETAAEPKLFVLHTNAYDFPYIPRKLNLYRVVPPGGGDKRVWSTQTIRAANWLRSTFSKPHYWEVVELTADEVESENTRLHWQEIDDADALREKKRLAALGRPKKK